MDDSRLETAPMKIEAQLKVISVVAGGSHIKVMGYPAEVMVLAENDIGFRTEWPMPQTLCPRIGDLFTITIEEVGDA